MPLDRLRKIVVVTDLIDELEKNGSWCGETHIQKATFAAQRLLGLPTDYDFILYKHGPFSFDMRDELSTLRADLMLDLVPREMPYGPSWRTTDASKALRAHYPKTLAAYRPKIAYVAERLGKMRVAELERVATAVYVRYDEGLAGEPALARIRELKPHVTDELARDALRTVASMAADAERISAEQPA